MAKQFFEDLPNTSTPINSTRLNGLLDGDEPMGQIVVDSVKTKNMLGVLNETVGPTYNVTAVSDDGTITVSGTSSGTAFLRFELSEPLVLEAGKSYTFSANNPSGIGTSTVGIILRLNTGESDDTTTDLILNNANAYKVLTPNSDITYKRITIRIANGVASSNFKIKPQTEVGTTATSYSKHQSLDGYSQSFINNAISQFAKVFELNTAGTYRISTNRYSSFFVFSTLGSNRICNYCWNGGSSVTSYDLIGTSQTLTYTNVSTGVFTFVLPANSRLNILGPNNLTIDKVS